MIFKIALRNTVKNWRHSLSALLSLSASFVSLVIFDGYMHDIQSMYIDNYRNRQMIGDVVIENKHLRLKEGLVDPHQFSLTLEQQNEILNEIQLQKNLVTDYVRNLNFQGLITNGKQSQIFLGRALDLHSGAKVRGQKWGWNVTFGQPLNLYSSSDVIALGHGLAEKLDCHWNPQLKQLTAYGNYEAKEKQFECLTKDFQLSATTADGQINAVDVEAKALIDGGYKDVDSRYIQTSLEVGQMLLATDRISFVSLFLSQDADLYTFINQFNQRIQSKYPDIVAKKWQDHSIGEMYQKTMDFLLIFRNFIIIVILVVSTLSVINTMIKIVKERTREIGTMRSLGFLKRQIQIIFVIESLMLCLTGGVIGTFLSILIMNIINNVHLTYSAGLLSEDVVFKIAFNPLTYIFALILLGFVGILATWIATQQAVRSRIIENLNHV